MHPGDLASLAGEETIFGGFAAEKLKRLQAELEPLSRRYDVVVANPPYMGSSNMNGWVSKWVKSNYPTAKSDLCTCFFERGQILAETIGYISMITASSWMFISSFEKFRRNLLSHGSICSMIQQSTHGYAGVTVPTTMFVYACNRLGVIGSYIRLEDFDRPQWQEPRALEALANPECGWFYRVNANKFKVIPGSPIDYWATDSAFRSFNEKQFLNEKIDARVGLITGDGNRFLRLWHEVGRSQISFGNKEGSGQTLKWVPYTKSGEFRLWYGNFDYVVNWERDGWEMKNDNYDGARVRAHNFNGPQSFKEGITWNSISSSRFHCRYVPKGFLFDAAGPLCEVLDEALLAFMLGLLSSSTFAYFMQLMNPTMNFPPGYLGAVPFVQPADAEKENVNKLVKGNVELSKQDWNSFETSWDFARHPLV